MNTLAKESFVKKLIANFEKFALEKCFLQKNDRILIAVSGGVDSIVLCELMAAANYAFGIAHCNFKLRGRASDEDATFVEAIAVKYGVPFYLTSFETMDYATQNKQSIQMAARKLRYEWLEKIRLKNQYKFIATAHHQNDLAETIIYNLTKGTGIAGLHGILAKKNKLIRPLLFSNKEKIKLFAQSQTLDYREDASNTDTKYTRNKIRHEVMPTLKSINPRLEDTFFENAQRFTEVEIIYQKGIEAYKKKLIEYNKNEILIAIRKLQKIPVVKTVLYELLKDYNFQSNQIDFILNALDSESGKIFYSPTHQLIKDRVFLILSKKTAKDTDHSLIFLGQNKLEKNDMSLSLETLEASNFDLPKTANIACFDASKVEFPLMLRRWKKGDYFYPFGMKSKKKKLSKFFIDLKLSLLEKERIWVLTDNRKRIIWVVGLRLDERFKITEKTQKVLKIEQVLKS